MSEYSEFNIVSDIQHLYKTFPTLIQGQENSRKRCCAPLKQAYDKIVLDALYDGESQVAQDLARNLQYPIVPYFTERQLDNLQHNANSATFMEIYRHARHATELRGMREDTGANNE